MSSSGTVVIWGSNSGRVTRIALALLSRFGCRVGAPDWALR
ncbi:hypothetical protein UM181_12005 [Alphaproteobacteria bacterium US3C007]|nr:hypothetical protein UM181_12005 [Alphaproteobacteria bacterium US3C007]